MMSNSKFIFCRGLAEKGFRCALIEGQLIIVDDFIPPNDRGIDPQPYFTISGTTPVRSIDFDSPHALSILDQEDEIQKLTSDTQPVKLIVPTGVKFYFFEQPKD